MTALFIPILSGWALGYIVNYLADVLPETRRLSRPACPNCGNAFLPVDYLLGRRCRTCGKPRSKRMWSALFILTGISVYIWSNPPHNLGYAVGLFLLAYFATVFIIDMEHRLILHPTSLVGAVFTFGAGWLAHDLIPTVLGGLAGLILMSSLYYFGRLFTRIRNRKLEASGLPMDDEEALGAGDVILAGILGLVLGWPLIWFGILLGILLGGVYGLLLVSFLYITRKNTGTAWMVFMPYGPFFILSTFFIIFLPNFVLYVVPK